MEIQAEINARVDAVLSSCREIFVHSAKLAQFESLIMIRMMRVDEGVMMFDILHKESKRISLTLDKVFRINRLGRYSLPLLASF